MTRMFWIRPHFPHFSKPVNPGKCCHCGKVAVVEKCCTLQCEPNSLDMWFQVCHRHEHVPVPSWQEVFDRRIRCMIGL